MSKVISSLLQPWKAICFWILLVLTPSPNTHQTSFTYGNNYETKRSTGQALSEEKREHKHTCFEAKENSKKYYTSNMNSPKNYMHTIFQLKKHQKVLHAISEVSQEGAIKVWWFLRAVPSRTLSKPCIIRKKKKKLCKFLKISFLELKFIDVMGKFNIQDVCKR